MVRVKNMEYTVYPRNGHVNRKLDYIIIKFWGAIFADKTIFWDDGRRLLWGEHG